MNTQRIQTFPIFTGVLALALLLSVAPATRLMAQDTTEQDKLLLERAKIAKQIVVDGQAGPLQAEQERQALERAQQGWQNMDAGRSAAAERKANWEAAKQEAVRLKQEREAKYWESAMNMERLLARQQEIQDERLRNEQAAQARDLKDWSMVGEATEQGYAEQQRREQIRQENLRRYQASLQAGYSALKPKDGMTVQQQVEAERAAREQQLLQYNLRYWNDVIKQGEDGKASQEAIVQANRENQIRHMRERVKEWGSIDQGKEESLKDLAVREQVRQANAARYQQQLLDDYKNSRAGDNLVVPSGVPGDPSLGAGAGATSAADAPLGTR